MLTGRRDQATTANLDSAITYDVAGQREPPADSTGIGSRELGPQRDARIHSSRRARAHDLAEKSAVDLFPPVSSECLRIDRRGFGAKLRNYELDRI
jgi:hypothetical protein